MSSPPFVHLHCHSHYSLLDGAGRIDRLVEQAKAVGLGPIIGYEAYTASSALGSGVEPASVIY